MPVSVTARLSLAESFGAVVTQRLDTFQDPNCEIIADGFTDRAIRLFSHGLPLDNKEVPEAKLGIISADQPRHKVVTGPVVNFTQGFDSELYHVRDGQLLHRTVDRGDAGELWLNPHLDEPVSDNHSQRLIDYITQLKERPNPIYQAGASDRDFWSSRWRLPVALPRQVVLDELFNATLDMLNSPGLSSKEIATRGLSGALIGKNDAEMVNEVILARDPSHTHGTRWEDDNDAHAGRIAATLGWKEINYGPRNESMAPQGYMRSIMGRNRNLYNDKDGAFSLAETETMRKQLGLKLLRLTEGYLWSARPTWNKPYGEPGVVVEAAAMSQSRQAAVLQQMGELAWALNWQQRWVAEIADLPKSSSLILPPPKTIAFVRNVLG
jgi:hypothetical protein